MLLFSANINATKIEAEVYFKVMFPYFTMAGSAHFKDWLKCGVVYQPNARVGHSPNFDNPTMYRTFIRTTCSIQ